MCASLWMLALKLGCPHIENIKLHPPDQLHHRLPITLDITSSLPIIKLYPPFVFKHTHTHTPVRDSLQIVVSLDPFKTSFKQHYLKKCVFLFEVENKVVKFILKA